MVPPSPVSSRREREREEMRQLIIDAARRLFVQEGYAQVTVRKIAEAIEYTPGAIYSYFEDKDAILHALHRQGFTELMRYMAEASARAAAEGGTPLDQLRRLGQAYLAFARENPEMYDLMFVAQAPVRAEPEAWPEGGRTFDVLRSLVRTAVDGGWIRAGDPESIAFALWSACHGMVTLEFRGRCKVVADSHRSSIVATSYDYLLGALAADEPPAPARRRARAATTPGRRRSVPES